MDIKMKILADCFIGIPTIAIFLIGTTDFLVKKVKRAYKRRKRTSRTDEL